MKPISYRGGIAEFELPADWREEYVDDGGATFYEDRPDSGTLRLSVHGFDGPESTTAADMVRTVFRPESGMVDEDFQDGLRLRSYMTTTESNGESLNIYRWQVAVPVSPRSLRLLHFTHTILTGQESDEKIAAELRMIEASIRAGRYSRDTGVAGSFRHAS